jgi:hypothetical protein
MKSIPARFHEAAAQLDAERRSAFPEKDTVSWRDLISEEMKRRGETMADVVNSTFTDAEFDAQFFPGFGGPEGSPFTLWTAEHVYFPVCYDGAEEAKSVPRYPSGEATEHVGGW